GTLITAGSAGTLVIVGGIAVTVGGALVIGGASIGAVAAAGFGEDVGNFFKAATNGSEGAGDYYKKGLEKISDN
ncbi:MAG: hypothetical protein LBV08_01760, partial [Clostridiales bacterium]|nr:hypothetical protein [Clostridiales bacterium]